MSIILFSALAGILTINGEPAPDTEVIRTAYLGKAYTQRVFTDAQGRFHFNKLTRRKSLLLFFPHQPLVDQKIVARANGQEYLLWDYLKYNYDDDLNVGLMHTNPTDSNIFFMQCELDDTEPYSQYLDWRAMVYSSCDLNFSHHNLTVAVTEYYQQNLEKIGGELHLALLSDKAKSQAEKNLRYAMLDGVEFQERNPAIDYPKDYDSRLLKYGRIENIELEMLDVEVRVKKSRILPQFSHSVHFTRNDNPPKLTTTIEAYGLYTFKVQGKIEQFFGYLMHNDVVFTYKPLAFDSIKLYGDGPVSFAMHATHQLNRISDEGKD